MKKTWITILVIIIIIVLGYWIWSAHSSSMGGGYAPAASDQTDQSGAPMIPATGTSTTYTATGATSSASPMLTVANDPTLGAYLVAANGMTLYTYSPDTTNMSNCTGACATAWPPYAVTGTPAAGSGVSGTLATYTRSDGSTQLTYNGMPLYFYAKDMKVGDTTGEGVGGVWYVVSP